MSVRIEGNSSPFPAGDPRLLPDGGLQGLAGSLHERVSYLKENSASTTLQEPQIQGLSQVAEFLGRGNKQGYIVEPVTLMRAATIAELVRTLPVQTTIMALRPQNVTRIGEALTDLGVAHGLVTGYKKNLKGRVNVVSSAAYSGLATQSNDSTKKILDAVRESQLLVVDDIGQITTGREGILTKFKGKIKIGFSPRRRNLSETRQATFGKEIAVVTTVIPDCIGPNAPAHYWMIGEPKPNDDILEGVCQHCQSRKEFPTSSALDYNGGDQLFLNGQRKRRRFDDSYDVSEFNIE